MRVPQTVRGRLAVAVGCYLGAVALTIGIRIAVGVVQAGFSWPFHQPSSLLGIALGVYLGIMTFPDGFGFESLEKVVWFFPHAVYLGFMFVLARQASPVRFLAVLVCFVSLLVVNIGGCVATPHLTSMS